MATSASSATSSAAVRKLPTDTPSSRKTVLGYSALTVALGISMLIAFNHQKTSASITHSTYYAVRRDPVAIEALGADIRFRDYWPWITGEINQIKGNIDFSYAIKGDKNEGQLHFRSVRQVKNSQEWHIVDWSLTLPNGKVLPLTRDDMVA